MREESETPQAVRVSAVRDSELPAITCANVTRDPRRLALGTALVLSVCAAILVASSLWVALLLGAVLAFTTQPLYRRWVARFGERRRPLIAAVVVLASGLTVLVFGALALFVLGRELMLLFGRLQDKLAQSGSASELLGPTLTRALARVHVDQSYLEARVHEVLAQAASRAAAATAVVLEETGSAAVTFVLAMVTEYYVLLGWARLALRLETVLPLEPRHTRALFLEFRNVGRGAFVGTAATGILQGILAAVGYALVGVPDSVAWGFATALASLLPIVGTLLVWVPVGVWEIMSGHPARGILVLVWGLLVVSATAEWVIRPRLVGSRQHTHPFLTLVALLGGVQALGLPGLIVAPIVMSLFLAVLRIYEREVLVMRRNVATTHS